MSHGGESEKGRAANSSSPGSEAALDAGRAAAPRRAPRAPRPAASAGVRLHPAGARAGARPRAPLIGRAGPLVTLFCLSGQRIKGAAAAVGTALSGLGYRSLEGGAEPLRGQLAVAGRPRPCPSLCPCRAADPGRRHPQLPRPARPLPSSRAQVKKGGAIARRGERRGSPASPGRLPAWGIEDCEG